MKITVNGQTHDVAEENGLRPLLRVLREELGITGPKAGCQEGSCGSCTVLVDGASRRSCLLAATMAADTAVTTVEGLGDAARLHPVQRAFHERYAAQCGYCTPGMIMAAVALLERSPAPDEADLADALDGHVCRCTGYVKILEAIRTAASARPTQGEQVIAS
jgi:carbon-monoxide dehydrogenase small subunit